MKKIISCLLIAIMMLSNLAFAEEPIEVVAEAEEYASFYDTTPTINTLDRRNPGDGVDKKDGIVFFDNAEWMTYSVTIPEDGTYSLSALVGTDDATSGLAVEYRGSIVFDASLSSTGGKTNYEEMVIGSIVLTAGVEEITLHAKTKAFNIDWFKLTYVGEAVTMLDEECTLEAEEADELTGELVDGGTGSAVAFTDGHSESYTLSGYHTKVYRVTVNAKGEGTLSFYLNNELIAERDATSDDYALVDFGNILFYEGEDVITLEVSGGTVNVDYINIKLFDLENLAPSSEMKIEAEAFIDSFDSSKNTTLSPASQMSFNRDDWMAYNIEVENAGFYTVKTYGAALDNTSVIKIIKGLDNDRNVIGSGAPVDSGESWSNFSYALSTITNIYLDEGENVLKLYYTGSGYQFDYFTLTYIGKGIEFIGATANDKVLATNSYIPRGTDKFVALFNTTPAESVIEDESIQILSNGESIPYVVEIVGSSVEINLLKTLDFDAEITFIMPGVKDITGATESLATEYVFWTDDTEGGEGYLSDVVISNDYEEITISGYLSSGNGYKMEGRTIEMFLTYPDRTESETAVASAVSGEDGRFDILYVLPETSDDGVYQVNLYAEYSEEAVEGTIKYMKKSTEKALFEELASKETSAEVKALIEDNAAVLGLDLENDLNPVDISDDEPFYAHFIGKLYADKGEFVADYEKFLLLERINQAFAEGTVDTILSDAEALGILGLPSEKLSSINKNKAQVITEIFELEPIADFDTFVNECILIIEKNLADETAAHEPVIVAQEVETTVGGAIEIILSLGEGYNEINEAVFEITSDGLSLASAKVEAADGCEAQVTADDDKAVVTVKPKWSLGATKDFGVLTVTAPDEPREYEINLSGVISLNKKYHPWEYENGEWKQSTEVKIDKILAYTQVLAIDVTVEEERSSGKKPSSNPGKSHESSGGGAAIIAPPVETTPPEETTAPPEETTKPDEPSKGGFADLSNFKWAEESINTLLEKGIVSKADNFYPEREITREEFVKMIVISLGIYDENAKAEFNDVSGDAWYASFIGSAQKAGVITGSGTGGFGVGEKITRQDMAVMLYRALSLTEAESAEKFGDDSEISDYAAAAVYKMRALGIINGVGDNSFAPKMTANRAMAAKIICGVLTMEVAE